MSKKSVSVEQEDEEDEEQEAWLKRLRGRRVASDGYWSRYSHPLGQAERLWKSENISHSAFCSQNCSSAIYESGLDTKDASPPEPAPEENPGIPNSGSAAFSTNYVSTADIVVAFAQRNPSLRTPRTYHRTDCRPQDPNIA
ncbi:hypothetical protein Q7C36_002133 [Tachysurus vachellii]|uniref:Uncharacterized protein n=1 Tax=Tachysurus vachellii TaxID=175792 RepID=A0AA88NSB2_TACVA|nr:hypothetical protein Q7C36_002133 [Tachysurus vachellii]